MTGEAMPDFDKADARARLTTLKDGPGTRRIALDALDRIEALEAALREIIAIERESVLTREGVIARRMLGRS